ncbi:vWA domain-containing protein [Acidiluteibacter ferrifornacis]|uniref:VWA domain-containing protein n=1 Tax=Acidiluteibacter ferrifornacis TaxID=2692424 RepID=A0A6N9NHH9_9FLAO|nr:VWA domain-containing protein [Acidiluteibacter ferrifornacis]MBR9832956.1 VWA domain-containing protein [bacterium]NBG65363.1 VWA domain-containing protein [Acidiluteibacter ferrifornacis]
MNNIQFANPSFFLLFALLPIALLWYFLRLKKKNADLKFSSLNWINPHNKSIKVLMRHTPFILEIICLSAIIFTLARPQSSLSYQNVVTEGIDIMIAFDISGSMLAEDLKPNRIEASKEVAIDFIKERPQDRIGLVVYSGESFTQCPLTTDHSVVINLFKDVKNGMIEDGTAIGLGLATAVNRLRESDAKSRVIILLTDGSNTAGSIPPLTAAEIAREFGVRVYTIGVGTNGKAPFPVTDAFGRSRYEMVDVKIDEKTLTDIAKTTGGKYFRATNNRKLAAIYEEIDQLEKSKIEVTEYRRKKEEFLPFALIASISLLLAIVLKTTVFKSIT